MPRQTNQCMPRTLNTYYCDGIECTTYDCMHLIHAQNNFVPLTIVHAGSFNVLT